jgi:hypothetical protein
VIKYIRLEGCIDRRKSAGGTNSRLVADAIREAKYVMRRP